MQRLVILFLLVVPAAAKAQASSRLSLIDDWQHQRTHILAVIDSATPEMLDFRPTPGVRTFAEQIQHIASVAARIVGEPIAGTRVPADLAGDPSVFLHDKAKLRAMADRHLAFVMSALQGMTDDQFAEEQRYAGGSMPRWRWNVTALQHSAWTLGQLVPYLRLNGRTPPQFTPF